MEVLLKGVASSPAPDIQMRGGRALSKTGLVHWIFQLCGSKASPTLSEVPPTPHAKTPSQVLVGDAGNTKDEHKVLVTSSGDVTQACQ